MAARTMLNTILRGAPKMARTSESENVLLAREEIWI
jgi:hypothetical protein